MGQEKDAIADKGDVSVDPENNPITDAEGVAGENGETDAGGEVPSGSAERELTEREKRLAEIAWQHNESTGIDFEDETGGEQEETAAAEDQTDGETAAAEDQSGERTVEDPLEKLGYYRKDDGGLYTRLKVNGEYREVPAEQIATYIQKDIAGDQKLQAAAEREKQLQEIERSIKEREEQLRQTMSQQKQPPKMGAEEVRDKAKSVLESLYDEDENKAADALVDFIQNSAPSVDQDAILQQAEQRAMTAIEQREAERQQNEWNKSVQEGNRKLAEDHPEIFQDPRLFATVNGETERMVELQQRGDPDFVGLTPAQIIQRAAEDVQTWLNGKRGDSSEEDTPSKRKATGKAGREERKSNLKPMPNGLHAKPAPKPAEEPDMSTEAVIERMKKSRVAAL